ncbi:MAG: leishmanolysin-related zinc metalloendopeptidase [Anaeromyxobacter sp.]
MIRRKVEWVLAVALLLAGVGGCGGGGGGNAAPQASITQPQALVATVVVGQAFSFAATCVDPDRDAVTPAWTFQGGTPASSAALSGTVTWAAVGEYAISFSCRDAGGHASAVVTRTVQVHENHPPVAAIATPAVDAPVTVGLPFTYLATCEDPDGETTTAAWSFPGGVPDSAAELGGSVTFAAAGDHQLSFQCHDPSHAASSVVTRTIHAVAPMAAGSLVAYSVAWQTGHPGEGISDPPAVKALDSNQDPIVGVVVTFTVTAGGGSLSTTTATTDVNGVARVASWTLGTSGAQLVTATATGMLPLTLAATLDGTASRFHIQLLFLAEPSADVRAAFTSAAERIGRVVTSELSGGQITFTADDLAGCGDTAVDVLADDLVILADVTAIDGAGSILGQAGPCLTRTTGSRLPVLGLMQFDEVDLANMDVHDLDSVILHEMLHVVGFGTYWTYAGHDFLGASASTTDPQYSGANAVNAYVGYNGGSGTTVPVEGTGGAGTKNAHWRETTFKNELMTGWLNGYPTAAPMSRTTIASLQDIGYTVDVTQADAYDIDTAISNLLAPGADARILDVSDDALPFTPRPVPGL